MIYVRRAFDNPIIKPNKDNKWETQAAFNPCVIRDGNVYNLLYRAQSDVQDYMGHRMNLSTIGHAISTDGIHFTDRRQLIVPENDWERYGCEDPRVVKLGDKYYIFYTALSTYPFTPEGIKLGVAITKDFKIIEEKHQATYFNSKAMSLFPDLSVVKLRLYLPPIRTDLHPKLP